MPLDVTLGEVTWRWQMRDDRALEDWLSRRPWLGEGGVIVVQAPDDADVTLSALEREVYAADRRGSEVRVVGLSSEASDFSDLIGEWLNVSRRRPRELALALADDLLARPAIFVVDARRGNGCTTWADDASALLDLASKLEVDRRPAIVVLHRRGEAPLRSRYVLDRGWPVGLAHALLETNDEGLWRKYVHLRFAWESGGVVDDGMDCAAIGAESPLNTDEDLEGVLNRFAMAKFHLMSEEERDGWRRYVDAPSEQAVPTVFGHSEEPEGRLTAYPWLARALLLEGLVQPGTRRALRAEVTCRPIAEQVLNRCFAAEASLRRRLPSSLPEPPSDLQDAYARFVANGTLGPSLVAELYPAGHPYPPADPWDFASVGLIVKHVAGRYKQWGELNRVTLLRNAAAHCHYMGWEGVREARALRGILE